MERNIRLNWQSLVEEARRRRKELKLTQQRLAAIADVSAPTVSRFENGEKNIQLSVPNADIVFLQRFAQGRRKRCHVAFIVYEGSGGG